MPSTICVRTLLSPNFMPAVQAEIITIGDEILYGQITNTNTQWISAELDKLGIKVQRQTTIGDTPQAITSALDEVAQRVQLVIMTGGLGPTKDDLTKKTLGDFFGSEMAINPQALAEVTALMANRGRELNELNRLQAMQPVKAQHLTNYLGTAPGLWFEERGVVWVSLPGVPYEMKDLMTRTVLPRLQAHFRTEIIMHRVVRTVGIPESDLAKRIEGWEDALPAHIGLAYLPSYGQVRLRLTATGASAEQLSQDIDAEVARLLLIIGEYVYGYDSTELEAAINQLLKDHHLTLAAAESFTGGAFASAITSVPGSSSQFLGGLVAYNNSVKTGVLGVPQGTIDQYGSVSEETALAMASQVRLLLGSDIGVSSTGVAGPATPADEAPVGTVYFGFADERGSHAIKVQLHTDREVNIKLGANTLLNFLRKQLLRRQA
jgi:nicotinamide-nucleotide amidase